MREEPAERRAAATGPGLAAGSKPGGRSRISLIIAAIRAHPTGGVAFRTGIAVLGGLVVIAGLVLVPLPGPGWLIVFAGLSIWAVEFVWARHLLRFGRRLLGTWTAWVSARSWPVKLLISVAGLVFVAVVAWLTLRVTFSVDPLDWLSEKARSSGPEPAFTS